MLNCMVFLFDPIFFGYCFQTHSASQEQALFKFLQNNLKTMPIKMQREYEVPEMYIHLLRKGDSTRFGTSCQQVPPLKSLFFKQEGCCELSHPDTALFTSCERELT